MLITDTTVRSNCDRSLYYNVRNKPTIESSKFLRSSFNLRRQKDLKYDSLSYAKDLLPTDYPFVSELLIFYCFSSRRSKRRFDLILLCVLEY